MLRTALVVLVIVAFGAALGEWRERRKMRDARRLRGPA
jgi:hypothetical protein